MRRVVIKHLSADSSPQLNAASELIERLYQNRGVTEKPDYSLGGLLPPTLNGLTEATERLIQALSSQEKILVMGDFDADGATATTLAVSALRAMGFEQVDWTIPDRFRHGYGLTPEVLSDIPKPLPNVILTVDQGISSFEGVAEANRLGMDVIITDHHLPGTALPEATAIVNPNLAGDPFPSKHLAGVGVVFYLMVALRGALRVQGSFMGRYEPRLDPWLDLVALGTVADLVTLDANNRLLVSQGIRRIRAGQTCPGIRALLEVAKRNLRFSTAADLAFAVAPRLNAAGRLDAMQKGVECLLASSEREARIHALALDAINQERKSVQASMQTQAQEQADTLMRDLETDLSGACLFEETWHQGVVGLVAGKIADKLQRPVVAFAPEEPGSSTLKGSARSPGAIHMRDALVQIDQSAPGLIRRFGGHAGAAGLTIERHALDQFREHFMSFLETIPSIESEVLSDGILAPELLTPAVAEMIEEAGPWGQGFSEPLFDGEFLVCERRIVGDAHLKLRLQPIDSKMTIDAIAFHAASLHQVTLPEPWRVTYRLEVNRFRGKANVQLNLQHWVLSAECSA